MKSTPTASRAAVGHRVFLAGVATTLAVLSPAPVWSARTPATCEKSKLVAAGKAVRSELQCHATAVATGAALAPGCVQMAQDALAQVFVTVEGEGGCPVPGDVVAVAAAVDQIVAVASTAFAPSGGPSQCAAAKLVAAANRGLNTFKAWAKFAKAPHSQNTPWTALAKAEMKYTAQVANAEGLADCLTSGDGVPVGIEIYATVASVADAGHGFLRDLAAARGRRLGASVQGDLLANGDSLYRDTAARQFSLVTTWGETVWANVEPNQGAFNLAPLDEIVDFAEQNGMWVKGITLVWDNYIPLPSWLMALSGPEFLAAVENHIRTLVGGYAGRIHMWDVVNEAVLGPSLRPSKFLTELGPGYIAQMFQLAHQADPTALLFYNEVGAQDLGGESDAVYQLMQDLLAQGVPVHGVGLQVHAALPFGTWASRESLQANIQRFADLGLRVQLSEVDVGGGDDPAANKLQRQKYHELMAACLAVPGCEMSIFGFTDAAIWVGNNPMPFDSFYRPKAGFSRIRAALMGY